MKKIPPRFIVLAAILAILAGLGATGALRFSDGASPGAFSAAGSPDALAQLADSQKEILERLDRLERRSGPAGTSGGASPASGDWPGSGRSQRQNSASLSPAAIAANRAALMRDRENRFVNEPLSAEWAAQTEKAIGRALSKETLEKEGAQAPKSMDSRCHSRTCRISMSFDAGVRADLTKVVLLEQIGQTLSRSEIFEEAGPDGSSRYVIYAAISLGR